MDRNYLPHMPRMDTAAASCKQVTLYNFDHNHHLGLALRSFAWLCCIYTVYNAHFSALALDSEKDQINPSAHVTNLKSTGWISTPTSSNGDI